MAISESVKDYSSGVKETQEESNVQWADGYDQKLLHPEEYLPCLIHLYPLRILWPDVIKGVYKIGKIGIIEHLPSTGLREDRHPVAASVLYGEIFTGCPAPEKIDRLPLA